MDSGADDKRLVATTDANRERIRELRRIRTGTAATDALLDERRREREREERKAEDRGARRR
jgi:hypothetical protein